MQSVNVTELQDNLSDYITRARSGEVILIRDRDVPVAKLVPVSEDKRSVNRRAFFTQEELDLEAAGLMRLPEKPWSKEELEEFLNLPMAHSKSGGDILTQALLDERAEGR
jgi:prevent-host-death family protein